MKSFLTEIAEAYLSNEAEKLIDYCFVFPNKRSETFFIHELAAATRRMGLKVVQPATSTVSDFIESFSPGTKADRLEMVFILFRAYKNVLRKHASGNPDALFRAETVDFNRFQFWADVILGDFNDVDMFLVEPEQLFINVERLREISSNYLTEEQREAITHFWKEQSIPPEAQAFWNHSVHLGEMRQEGAEDATKADDGKIKASAEFLKLWQVMGEVYTEFRRMLEEKGLFYSGMAYRTAVDDIRRRRSGDFWYRRYIFVGFNMLSKAETTIFSLLRDKPSDDGPLADFYWDIASPAFDDMGNTAAYLLKRYADDFPSLYDCVTPADGFPQIEIIGLPSRAGQAKLIGQLLGEIHPEGTDEDSLRETAVVLPDETLTVPLLRSIPENITPLNITMGYRLRNTAVAGLLRDIVAMQLHCRLSGGIPCFYYEDVKTVLSHPLMRNADAALCDTIMLEINVNRWFNIPESFFGGQWADSFRKVFSAVSNHLDAESVFNYLDSLLSWLGDCLLREVNRQGATTEGEAVMPSLFGSVEEPLAADYTETDDITLPVSGKLPAETAVQWAFVKRYADAVKHVRSLYDTYLKQSGLTLEDTTVFNLVERLVGGETVNFEGRPLKGLQIMGVLETRSIDFSTLILPSMNERIFPRKHYSRTFIPNNLRSAYGMSTTEHQESIYAYYFYRMIARAKRVYLLYDARTSGTRNGTVSRYIFQLLHIFKPEGMVKRVVSYPVSPSPGGAVTVEKDSRILKELARFRSDDNPRYFSASSINQYINCPMAFYLQYIEGYKREDTKDYIDESVYGTIVHEVLQNMYDELKGEAPQVRIDVATLDGLRKEKTRIERLIRRSINRNYRTGKINDLDKPLTGDGKIFANIIASTVDHLLEKEKGMAPFYYIAGEHVNRGSLLLRGETPSDPSSQRREMRVNFYYCIDRIDRRIYDDSATRLRIIDYKTGNDPTEVLGIDHMFENKGSNSRAKAALQLYLYSEAYGQFEGLSEPVQPMLYVLRKIAVNGLTPLTLAEKEPGKRAYDKREITDYHTDIGRVNDRLIDFLDELFDPDTPFRMADDDHACKFCSFTGICRREPKDY